ncbi:MAG TPA: FkbM family methyltransferase [Rhizomicrobium sp.]|jgi:FkbM family methyltransferase
MVAPLKCFIAGNSFGSYCVPAASKRRPAARAILRGEVWEPETIAFLTQHCGAGDIVHAGTYFGDFLPALSRALATGAHIWAFEPSLTNFRCAEITLKLNGISNVVLTHAGLGACHAPARLRVGEDGRHDAGGGSTIVADDIAGFEHEDTQLVTVDETVPASRAIAVLQLDVEGYEQEALEGALETIRRCRPVLVLEKPPRDPGWFESRVLSLGYRQTGTLHVNQIYEIQK